MRRSFLDVFLLVLPLAGLTFGLLVYALMLHRHEDGVGLSVALGLICGTVFGVGAGYFVRTLEYVADVEASGDMSLRIEMALVEMGYRLEHRYQKVVTFRPSLRAGLFADRIRVELMNSRLRLEGPHLHVEKLVARLCI